MKKSWVILFVAVICSSSASSQWKKIARLPYTAITGATQDGFVECIYFIDLLGPLRIGFVGTHEGNMWKTIDGGKTWRQVLDYPGIIRDICFKDSLIGWASLGTDIETQAYVYKTTDGGDSWSPLTYRLVDEYGSPEDLIYLPKYHRLLLGWYWDTNQVGIKMSTDLGNHWREIWVGSAGGFAFTDDSIGLAGTGKAWDSTLIRTTDGGLTWKSFPSTIPGGYLPIKGTGTFFHVDYGHIVIRRSDDFGTTWRVIKDFGPNFDSAYRQISPIGTGRIVGDLFRLYIQTDSGMFVSTDEGVTWKKQGPPQLVWTADGSGLFAAKGKAFAGQSYTYQDAQTGGGLWEEDYGSADVEAKPAMSGPLVAIFPNPTHDRVMLTLEGPASYEVLDMLGIVRLRGRSEGQSVTIELSCLPAGVYYLQVERGAMASPRQVKIVKE